MRSRKRSRVIDRHRKDHTTPSTWTQRHTTMTLKSSVEEKAVPCTSRPCGHPCASPISSKHVDVYADKIKARLRQELRPDWHHRLAGQRIVSSTP